jgi:hypothetical protein
MEYPIKAKCPCGQVSYQLYQAPAKVIACHCRECQKLSSAPFSVTAFVAADQIKFTGTMHETRRVADSGRENVGVFCPDCGVRIYQYDPQNPSMVKLKLKPVGSDVDPLFEPQAHIWTSEKQAWFTLPDGVKSFDKAPS